MISNHKRVALVTGANRGIGFEIAGKLAEKDITVIIGSRDETKGIEARDKLVTRNLDVHFILLDVTDKMNIQNAVEKIKDNFGRLDILVNNAGIIIDSHTQILELSLNLLKKTFETNAFAPLLLSQAFVPLMKKNGYGRIVNMSSTLGSLSDIINPESSNKDIQAPAYRLSKTLLNGMTVLLAGELQESNILVNSVCPGWVRTQMGGEEAPLTPKQAAITPVWLATLPDDGPTGGFFRENHPIPW
jgi:NAD(P)-dependent dehydrogenase (short-subunit alcohol dehydrogenase family)